MILAPVARQIICPVRDRWTVGAARARRRQRGGL